MGREVRAAALRAARLQVGLLQRVVPAPQCAQGLMPDRARSALMANGSCSFTYVLTVFYFIFRLILIKGCTPCGPLQLVFPPHLVAWTPVSRAGQFARISLL